jgi:hypothetical protein
MSKPAANSASVQRNICSSSFNWVASGTGSLTYLVPDEPDEATMRFMIVTLSALAAAPALAVAPVPVYDVAAVRASMAGSWTGTLEYLDYSANKWFGIPVNTLIEDQRDGATTIRKSDFDDGPKVGMVRITTVELFDAAKSIVTAGTFRKGRDSSLTTYIVRLDGAPKDLTHWTMIEETKSEDDSRPAMLRLTTVRDGDSVETLKEVDFLDDNKTEWMKRNRTRLKLVK